MASLSVKLFGCPQVSDSSNGSEIRLPKIVQALFAYLLVERHRPHSREVLAGIFWGDNSQEKARACLNTAVWRLRSTIEDAIHPDSPYLLMTPQGEISFNANSSYWLDIEAFENLVNQITPGSTSSAPGDHIRSAEQAVELYQGDLLEGYYSDWVLRERERLNSRYLACLAYLMSACYDQNDIESSLWYGQELLNREPLSEQTHRALMRIYWQSGQRAMAIRQYERCRSILQTELGIAPMPETEKLYQQVISDESPGEHRVTIPSFPTIKIGMHEETSPDSISEWIVSTTHAIEDGTYTLSNREVELLRKTLQELNQALSMSEFAWKQIQQAIWNIEDLLQSK